MKTVAEKEADFEREAVQRELRQRAWGAARKACRCSDTLPRLYLGQTWCTRCEGWVE